MKRVLMTFVLVSLIALPLSAATTAEQAEEKKPSWIERLFGTKESAKGAKDTDVETDVKEETPDDTEKSGDEAPQKENKKPEKDLKFSEEDTQVLQNWQQGKASWKKSKKKLPPGLQKKIDRGGELPPGWQKKLEVGTVLEPELDEVAIPLPEEILSRLPDIPEDTEIVQIGDEIIRVVESTREIIDILGGIGASD